MWLVLWQVLPLAPAQTSPLQVWVGKSGGSFHTPSSPRCCRSSQPLPQEVPDG